ncbi:hypothetical protein Gotri_026925 [Gossypium trilobum]|uniref:Uncharacterized protein n=1 Tax=Gossypium trilobum TaxID=34281 RepID=A0A7J9FQJ9_9ROSI|nr:hypothetical protein [Gossypium trilobum]
MKIKLSQELIVQSDKKIDGRRANVHIAYGCSITLQFVHNVIIHNIHVHHVVESHGGLIRDSEDTLVFERLVMGMEMIKTIVERHYGTILEKIIVERHSSTIPETSKTIAERCYGITILSSKTIAERHYGITNLKNKTVVERHYGNTTENE